MATYTIIIPPETDPGITAAKDAHNASLETNADGTFPPAYCADTNAYVQKVMENAAVGYCSQFGITGLPTNSVAPTLDKTTATVGQRVTSGNGTWTGSPAVTSYLYQWQNKGVNIRMATANSYISTAGEAGGSLVCRVTAVSTAGSKAAYSNACAVT